MGDGILSIDELNVYWGLGHLMKLLIQILVTLSQSLQWSPREH